MAKKSDWVKQARYLNMALSLGISMVLVILLGVFGGDWLDRRLGTSPAFLLLGIFLGIGAGFYNLWSELSAILEVNKKGKLEEKKQHEGKEENGQFKAGE